MRNAPIRYGVRFGCRFGQAHDLRIKGQTPDRMYEKCAICQKQFKWGKAYKGRIANARYLKAHVRQYAQRIGSTKRVFFKLYEPEKTTIIL